MAPDTVRFGRRVFIAVLIAGLIAAVAYAIDLLLFVFAGILLAIFLRTLREWLSAHTRLSINHSMILVLIAFAGICFGTVWMFGSQIAQQADALFAAVSQAFTDFQERFKHYRIANQLLAHTSGFNLMWRRRQRPQPPALILATQFLMDIFAGTTGITFATPLMVVAMVLIKTLYFKQDWTE